MEDGYRTCEVVISPERNIKKTNVTVSQNGHEAQATVKHKNATTIIQVKHGEKFVKADLVIVTSSKKPPPASSTFRIPAADIEVSHLFTCEFPVGIRFAGEMKIFVESKIETWALQHKSKCHEITPGDASAYHIHSTSLETRNAIAKEMKVKLQSLDNAMAPTGSSVSGSVGVEKKEGIVDVFKQEDHRTILYLEGPTDAPFYDALCQAAEIQRKQLIVKSDNSSAPHQMSTADQVVPWLKKLHAIPENQSYIRKIVVVEDNDLGILVDGDNCGRLYSCIGEDGTQSFCHRLRLGRAVENYLIPLCTPLHLLRRPRLNHLSNTPLFTATFAESTSPATKTAIAMHVLGLRDGHVDLLNADVPSFDLQFRFVGRKSADKVTAFKNPRFNKQNCKKLKCTQITVNSALPPPSGAQVAFDFCCEVLTTVSKQIFPTAGGCTKAWLRDESFGEARASFETKLGDAVVPDVFTATAVLRLNNLLEVDDPEKMVKPAQEILALLDKENFKEERNNIGNIATLKDDRSDANSSKDVAEAAARKLADLEKVLPEFFEFSSSPGVGDGKAVARFPPWVLGKGESPRGLDLPSLLAKCTQQYHRLCCLQEGLPLSDESEKPQGGKKVAASSAAGGPGQKDTEGSKLACQVIARFLFLVQDQYLALFRTPHKGKPIGGKFSMTKALFKCTAKGCSCSEVLRLAPDFSRCACCRHKVSAHDGWFEEEATQYKAKNLEWCAATNFYLALCLCAPLMWDSHPYMQAMRGEEWLGEREVKAQNRPTDWLSARNSEQLLWLRINDEPNHREEDAKTFDAYYVEGNGDVVNAELKQWMKQWIEKVLNTQTNLLSNAPSSVSQAWWELTQNRQEELKGLCSLLRDHNPEDAAPVAGGGNST